MHFDFEPAQFPESEDGLRRKVRTFVASCMSEGVFRPVSSGWMAYNREFSLRCGREGFIGMTWPKAYGGGERSPVERYVVLEELLAAGAPMGAHWIADRQSGPQIIRFGAVALKQAVLPRIVRGEVTFAIGMSEPDAGSDLSSIRSRAVRSDGGWLLGGRKIWTTNGHRAGYMIGLFRTGEARSEARHAGLTQFVIDMASAGVAVRPIRDMTGNEDFCEITLDDVFVPDENVLGVPGEGWALVMSELANERSGPERFLSAFPLLALAGKAVETDADLGEFGRLVAHGAVLRAMSSSIASRLVGGEAPALEAAITKDLGNEYERATPEIVRRACGVSSFDGELGEMLAQVTLAAPSYTLRGGTPEILRGIIARGLGLR